MTVAFGSLGCNPRPAVSTAPDGPTAQSRPDPPPGNPPPPTDLTPTNPPAPPACPAAPPQHGEACTTPGQRCGYPACSMPDHMMATCEGTTWQVVMGTCNPPPPPEPTPPSRNPPRPR